MGWGGWVGATLDGLGADDDCTIIITRRSIYGIIVFFFLFCG